MKLEYSLEKNDTVLQASLYCIDDKFWLEYNFVPLLL